MTIIRQLTPSDYDKWNNYVYSSTKATPYHLLAWKNAIENTYNNKTNYLIAENDDEVVGVLPLCLVKAPFFSGSLCSLPYCDLGGPLAHTTQVRDQLIQKAIDLCAPIGAKNIIIREKAANNTVSINTSKDMSNQKVSMLLTLPDTSDELLNNFKSKLRSQIRKAEKNGLTYKYGKDKDHITAFYRIYTQNMKKLGSPPHSYNWFNEIKNQYADNMIVGLVYLNDMAIGAGLLLFLNSKVAIPWASTIAKYNHLAPNMLLYWSLLKYSCDTNHKQFDFGRSTYGQGTYRFKYQWGAKPVELNWKKYNSSGELICNETVDKNLIRPVVENIWSKLPLIMTNNIGPIVRQYISL